MGLTLKGINSGGFGGYDLTDMVFYNLKFWLDWGLANAGAFGLASLSASGYYGENAECYLKPYIDERIENGKVWVGMGKEWVWESGVVSTTPPVRVSGIYVQDMFFPIGSTAPYSYHIDYRNGRVVFDEPIDPAWQVAAEYAWRQVNVDTADSPDFRILMQNSLGDFLAKTPIETTPAREHQILLPAIFIDMIAGSSRGLELGGGQIKTRKILLQIFANSPGERNLLLDWLDFQNRATFNLCDLNKIVFPLDENGDVLPTATNWVDLVNSYPWRKMRILNGVCSKLDSINPQIFRGRVEWEVEVDVHGI